MDRWYKQNTLGRSFFAVLLTLLAITDVLALSACVFWVSVVTAETAVPIVMPFLNFGFALCLLAAACLSVQRLIAYPANRGDYFRWLAFTPWQSTLRTPFGPWHPMLRDALPLGLITALAAVHAVFYKTLTHTVAVSPAVILQGSQYLAAALILPTLIYILFWAIGGYLTVFKKWDWCGYTTLMVVGLMMHVTLYVPITVTIAISAVLIAVGVIAVWWRMKYVLNEIQTFHLAGNVEPPEMRKTTPTFEVLHPRIRHKVVSEQLSEFSRKKWAYGLLMFVWLTLVSWPQEAAMTVPILVSLLGLVRVAAYHLKQSSHLGATARWATGHLIVPDFDKVWLVPLWMVCVSAAISLAWFCGILPPSIGFALSIVAPVILATTCGPNYEAWTLTAPLRYPRRKPPQPHNKRQSVKTA